MYKLLQVKSTGVSLQTDLDQAFQQIGGSPPAAQQQENILCYVKDKRVKERHFKPHNGSLVTFLLPSECYRNSFFVLAPEHIAYEDDALIVIDKPHGLSTQGTHKFAEDHLYGAVISALTKPHANKLAYVGLHHRLDRDTSGLVLFTKKSSANKSIAHQFQEHTILKKYEAIGVGQKPKPEQWVCAQPLRRDFSNPKLFRFRVDLKGDSAKTQFLWKKEISPDCHLIECTPFTGRTHQIRIHLKESRLPILGDRTYGRSPYERMLLHACSLTFKHPLTNKEVSVSSKYQLEHSFK